MRRIIMLVVVALVMAAMMLAMALPVFAKGGAAGECDSPGQSTSIDAKFPGSTPEVVGVPPGQHVSTECAPGHLN
jgi:hypothetical protein